MHNHEYVLKKNPNKCLNFVAVFARLDSYNVCGTRTVNNDDDFDFVILLTVPKDAGIIHKLHSVKLCLLSFSCISVAHWYEINKWIDDHDKATVPTFKKRGTHSLRTQICSVSFIYFFSV